MHHPKEEPNSPAVFSAHGQEERVGQPKDEPTSPTSSWNMYDEAMQQAAADWDVDSREISTNTSKCEQPPMVEFDVYPFAKHHLSIDASVFSKIKAIILDISYVPSPEETAKFAAMNEERGIIDLRKGEGSDTIAKFGTEPITYATVYRLYTKAWLDDVAINVYMKMLAAIEASLDKEQGAIRQNRNLFFTSNLVTMLRASTSSVASWTRTLTTSLFRYNKIFFPCNIQDTHWFLIVVDNEERSVSLYDPLHESHVEYLKNVRQYVYDEYERIYGTQIPCEYETNDMGRTFPGQADSCSCGVYTCLYANRISQGYRLETIQSVNGAFQYRMYMLCLLNQLMQI